MVDRVRQEVWAERGPRSVLFKFRQIAFFAKW